ncbi:cysteine-rich receptor-like protein kinase 27 [Neltuma alba]|uniref:cysteine-rich receptor-like protein kinase 27 n=1 Tax=Neltuma alba TaxID=207710 RepID=UPI0010A5463B|nr:cysteine-rich receptor-like protein kinase 27 [Prosopis alba]
MVAKEAEFLNGAAISDLRVTDSMKLRLTCRLQYQHRSGKHSKSRVVIEIIAPIVGFVVLLSLVGVYAAKGRKLRTAIQSELEANDNEIKPAESIQFNFRTIKVATNSFSDGNKLGQGGFGPVYKGKLSNGQNIAVKRLSGVSGQGDTEFKNEVLLMAKLQHRNLVQLFATNSKQDDILEWKKNINSGMNELDDGIMENELNVNGMRRTQSPNNAVSPFSRQKTASVLLLFSYSVELSLRRKGRTSACSPSVSIH